MASKDILDRFFGREFENYIFNKMLMYSYVFEDDLVKEYINELVSVPIDEYIKYILINRVAFLDASDVFQFSNFEDCTKGICKILKECGDSGIDILNIGKALENDGVERQDGAYRKYGENQVKAAEQLGLVYNLANKYFLSPIGYVFNDLNEDLQVSLLVRLILRNKLIRVLIFKSYKNGYSSYIEETQVLKKTTQDRRKTNVKFVINFLKKYGGFLSNEVFDNIKF